MRRREFITLIGGAAATWPLEAQAQQSSKTMKRMALVSPSDKITDMFVTNPFIYGPLFKELSRLGYVEGDNLIVERYSANGQSDHFDELARDVVGTHPDVIRSASTRLALAFKKYTATIPIVAVCSDPVADGLVSSLARPGGNITGVSVDAGIEIWGKRLGLLLEVIQKPSNVQFLASREAMGRAAEIVAPSSSLRTDGGFPVAQVNDLSRSLTAFDPISTLVVVVEMSKVSWLVSGVVPGVERQPLKKLEPDATALLRLIERWRNEAVRAGHPISRIALAYEAGRDGFWLARWLIARGIDAHVIHSASVAVSRERKRAKTDRLDAAMLMRVFLGWLRGERGHCGMVAIPTMEEEDARRPSRERESLVDERSRITNRMKSALARLGIRGFKAHLRKAPERLAGLRTAEGTGLPANTIEEFRRDMARLALVREQISLIEKTRAERLERAPDTGPHAMVRLLARVIGIGIETADMLVREILSRKLRDRRAVARYAGLTGSPDESGLKRREKGLAKAGNARVRRGLIQLAWRFLMFQKNSALAQWYRTRTEGPSGARKTTMIVALARKLLIALWRLVTTGEVLDGVELRPAA